MKLITRSDFDGLVCAAILQELGIVDDIRFVHPKDVQDGKVAVTPDDVLANVPFVKGCGLWFDHHSSEQQRLEHHGQFEGACMPAPSAARVIADYYGKDPAYADRLGKFDELLMVVDIADAAQFSEVDILDPRGWMLLAFIADPRTGLGLKKDFAVSNIELMRRLPELLRTKDAEAILAMPDFADRVAVYREENERYKQFLLATARIRGDAILLDFRGIEDIPSGNRFMEYVVFPDKNISVRIMDGRNRERAVVSLGHSIINRSSTVDVGALMYTYGGGGHKAAGTCQVSYEDVDRVVAEVLAVINR
jgi:oligoribonuclease NrnB/cAMP/cGMP phosphodiesterase (DHH superfamily)